MPAAARESGRSRSGKEEGCSCIDRQYKRLNDCSACVMHSHASVKVSTTCSDNCGTVCEDRQSMHTAGIMEMLKKNRLKSWCHIEAIGLPENIGVRVLTASWQAWACLVGAVSGWAGHAGHGHGRLRPGTPGTGWESHAQVVQARHGLGKPCSGWAGPPPNRYGRKCRRYRSSEMVNWSWLLLWTRLKDSGTEKGQVP